MHRTFGCGLAMLAIVLAQSGCTAGLNSTPTTHGTTNAGIVYQLPMRVIQSTVVVELRRCEWDERREFLEFELKYSGTITNRLQPNPDDAHVLRYQDMATVLKTSSAEVAFHGNGTLKSVNASITDKSAGFLSGLLDTFINLSTPTLGLKIEDPDKMAAAGDRTKEFCSLDALAALEIKKSVAAEIGDATQKYLESVSQLDKQMGDAQQKVASATKVRDSAKAKGDEKALKLAEENLKTAAAVLVALKTRRAKLTGPVLPKGIAEKVKAANAVLRYSVQQEFYASDGNERAQFGELHKERALSKWLTEAGQEFVASSEDPDRPIMQYHLILARPPGGSQPASSGASSTGLSDGGIYYRTPVILKVYLCKAECVLTDGSIRTSDVIANGMLSFPQFGSLASLELTNSAFQATSLEVDFAEDGSLARVKHASDKAAAEEIANLASGASESYIKLRKARDDAAIAAKDALRQEELDAIDHEISLLKKRKELEDAENGIFAE